MPDTIPIPKQSRRRWIVFILLLLIGSFLYYGWSLPKGNPLVEFSLLPTYDDEWNIEEIRIRLGHPLNVRVEVEKYNLTQSKVIFMFEKPEGSLNSGRSWKKILLNKPEYTPAYHSLNYDTEAQELIFHYDPDRLIRLYEPGNYDLVSYKIPNGDLIVIRMSIEKTFN
ncbi:MAG: hypothetical protein R3C11_19950 [Planctomycetaceae bacterium]